MNQLELRLARRSDPPASKEAARRIVSTGAIGRQQAQTLDAVRRYPGRTSKEIAALACLDYHATARRLPELLAKGLVTRQERASGCRWFPGRRRAEEIRSELLT